MLIVLISDKLYLCAENEKSSPCGDLELHGSDLNYIAGKIS
jgi:hypothetical protein